MRNFKCKEEQTVREATPSSIFLHATRLHKEGSRYVLLELEREGFAGIVPGHGEILKHLNLRESCKMTHLARLIHRSKSTTTVLVEKLEKGCYVKREQDPDDLRGVRVRLTDKGRELGSVLRNIYLDFDDILRKRLTEGEMRELNRLLEKSAHVPSHDEIFS